MTRTHTSQRIGAEGKEDSGEELNRLQINECEAIEEQEKKKKKKNGIEKGYDPSVGERVTIDWYLVFKYETRWTRWTQEEEEEVKED